MGIIKNAIPILEFDTEQTAVISPVHENLQLNLPKKCVFAFLGNCIDEYADKSDTKQVSSFISVTKSYPIYVKERKLFFVRHLSVRLLLRKSLIG